MLTKIKFNSPDAFITSNHWSDWPQFIQRSVRPSTATNSGSADSPESSNRSHSYVTTATSIRCGEGVMVFARNRRHWSHSITGNWWKILAMGCLQYSSLLGSAGVHEVLWDGERVQDSICLMSRSGRCWSATGPWSEPKRLTATGFRSWKFLVSDPVLTRGKGLAAQTSRSIQCSKVIVKITWSKYTTVCQEKLLALIATLPCFD